jgi:hypothetical protein
VPSVRLTTPVFWLKGVGAGVGATVAALAGICGAGTRVAGVGDAVGTAVGADVGVAVGSGVGSAVGAVVGIAVGAGEGTAVGVGVGWAKQLVPPSRPCVHSPTPHATQDCCPDAAWNLSLGQNWQAAASKKEVYVPGGQARQPSDSVALSRCVRVSWRRPPLEAAAAAVAAAAPEPPTLAAAAAAAAVLEPEPEAAAAAAAAAAEPEPEAAAAAAAAAAAVPEPEVALCAGGAEEGAAVGPSVAVVVAGVPRLIDEFVASW